MFDIEKEASEYASSVAAYNSLLKENENLIHTAYAKGAMDMEQAIKDKYILVEEVDLKTQVSKDEIIFNKSMRKQIDEIIQMVKDAPSSRERSLSITKLQEAVMWLGMDLKRLGSANPYPSSKDPSTGAVVEPTADGLKL